MFDPIGPRDKLDAAVREFFEGLHPGEIVDDWVVVAHRVGLDDLALDKTSYAERSFQPNHSTRGILSQALTTANRERIGQ
jgi:hypothetical protein